jgi:hypothetical protein
MPSQCIGRLALRERRRYCKSPETTCLTVPVTVDSGELGVVDVEVDDVEPVGADEPVGDVSCEVVEPSVETVDLSVLLTAEVVEFSVLFSDEVVVLTAPVTVLTAWWTVDVAPLVTCETVPPAVLPTLDVLLPARDTVCSVEPVDGAPPGAELAV